MSPENENNERPQAGTFVGNILDHRDHLVARVIEVDGRFFLLNVEGGIIELTPRKEPS